MRSKLSRPPQTGGPSWSGGRVRTGATGLVHPEGRLALMIGVDDESFQIVREAMHTIQPDAEVSIESLENALAQTHARLHAGLQQAATAGGFSYELTIHRESESEPFSVADPASHPPLLVLALERADHASQGHVHDRIRRSPHPLLVVSVE